MRVQVEICVYTYVQYATARVQCVHVCVCLYVYTVCSGMIVHTYPHGDIDN